MANVYDNNEDFQFKWHAANGSTADRYAQIKAQNDARIAELQAELKQLEGKKSGYLGEDDLLDLELAENRARAYDMNGATTALSRIDSRTQNRVSNARALAKEKNLDEETKALKRSDLEAKIRELQIKRAQAKVQTEKDIIDAQLKDLGNQLNTAGGKYVPAQYTGTDTGEALKGYYDSTVNTKNGRVFLPEVGAERRQQIRNDLLAVGEYEKAAEIEAKATVAEKEAQKKKIQQTKQKIKTRINLINDALTRTKFVSDPNSSDYALHQEALAQADSLAKNYPSYVKIENGKPKFIGKD